MNKDKIYRITGFLLIVSSIYLIVSVDLSQVTAILAGLFLGVGISLLTSGENIHRSWHY